MATPKTRPTGVAALVILEVPGGLMFLFGGLVLIALGAVGAMVGVPWFLGAIAGVNARMR